MKLPLGTPGISSDRSQPQRPALLTGWGRTAPTLATVTTRPAETDVQAGAAAG